MSALFPDEVRNQQAANALLNRHRLGSFTLGIPIAQLQVVEGTRPVDESYVQELQSYMDGKIDQKRWPCRVVFLLRSSVPISLEAGQRLFETLRRANKAAIRRGDLNWLYDEFEVSVSLASWLGVCGADSCSSFSRSDSLTGSTGPSR